MVMENNTGSLQEIVESPVLNFSVQSESNELEEIKHPEVTNQEENKEK